MIARRLVGIVLSLLMLQLSLLGADASCARHGDHGRVRSQTGTQHDAHLMAPAQAAVANAEQPCETPTQPDCCRAMTSCAVNIAFGSGTRISSLPAAHEAIRPDAMRTPQSRITAPEPPPPRA
ncbi:MAG TPA: hypothetical protein VIP11_19970 [Gemmatimonadaceae bacterium]